MRGSLRPKSGLELCMCPRVTAQSLAFRMLLPAARSCRQRLHGRDTLPRSANPRPLKCDARRSPLTIRVLMRTGNLAAVMKTIGHRDVKTAMHYQHPELDVVLAALDYRVASETTEMRACEK